MRSAHGEDLADQDFLVLQLTEPMQVLFLGRGWGEEVNGCSGGQRRRWASTVGGGKWQKPLPPLLVLIAGLDGGETTVKMAANLW